MSTTTTITEAIVPSQLGTTAQAVASLKPEEPKQDTSSILHSKISVAPPKIVKAQGNNLITSDGISIFDATGGAAVACLGHGHPRVKAAITAQLDSVAYCYAPFFSTQASEDLASHLTATTGGEMSKVFIVSSGTEAIEAALKLCRQYFLELEGPSTARKNFIARNQSYHGNTLGALAVGGHKARKAIYEPILSTNVSHVSPCYPYRGKQDNESDEKYVQRLASELEAEFQRLGPDTVCAFVMETMPGLTLGAVPPPPGYLSAMKSVCERHGALFILDEVMCGMGRTGHLHAWQSENVVPHLQTVAKGLGAGYEPIGALLVHKSVVDVFEKGTGSFVHSQTYQGHPVACAAALEVQKIVQEERLLENVKSLASVLENGLKEKLGGHRFVGDIRGRGFMWGVSEMFRADCFELFADFVQIELVKDKTTKAPFPASEKVSARIHAAGLTKDFGISILPGGGVADGVSGDVIMLAPAYNCTKQDIELIVERTAKVIEHVLGQ